MLQGYSFHATLEIDSVLTVDVVSGYVPNESHPGLQPGQHCKVHVCEPGHAQLAWTTCMRGGCPHLSPFCKSTTPPAIACMWRAQDKPTVPDTLPVCGPYPIAPN